MDSAPKRVWSDTGAVDVDTVCGPRTTVEYHRADLSTELVRAGYQAGLEAAAMHLAKQAVPIVGTPYSCGPNKWVGFVRDTPADPETIAAIVASTIKTFERN